MPLSEGEHCRPDHFLQGLFLGMQRAVRVVGDSHDGEEILYHPAEPVGILLGSFEQFSLLLSGQILFIVQTTPTASMVMNVSG